MFITWNKKILPDLSVTIDFFSVCCFFLQNYTLEPKKENICPNFNTIFFEIKKEVKVIEEEEVQLKEGTHLFTHFTIPLSRLFLTCLFLSFLPFIGLHLRPNPEKVDVFTAQTDTNTYMCCVSIIPLLLTHHQFTRFSPKILIRFRSNTLQNPDYQKREFGSKPI